MALAALSSAGALTVTWQATGGHDEGNVGILWFYRLSYDWNQIVISLLFCMTDPMEEVLAPCVIEQAMTIFEGFKERGHCEIVQKRKALKEHVFGLIASGETDEKRLVIAGLTHLKSLESRDR